MVKFEKIEGGTMPAAWHIFLEAATCDAGRLMTHIPGVRQVISPGHDPAQGMFVLVNKRLTLCCLSPRAQKHHRGSTGPALCSH